MFVDIRMPGATGLELIRRLKPSLPDSVYVILSGYSEFEYAQSAIRLDVFEYFLKPYDEEDAEELLERLSLHLSKRHAPQESAQEAPSLHSNQQFNRLLQHVDQHVYEPLNLGTAGLRVLSQRQLLQPAVQIRHGQDLLQLRARQAHRAGQGAVGRFRPCPSRMWPRPVGYDDLHYFTRIFAGQVGVPPRKYRAEAQHTKDAEGR